MEKAVLDMKKNLKAVLHEIDYVATTTDCWTVFRQSFIGVTAHWINPDTLERCSAASACTQLKGSCTFSAIAGALNNMHSEYNIVRRLYVQLLIMAPTS